MLLVLVGLVVVVVEKFRRVLGGGGERSLYTNISETLLIIQ